MQYPETVKIVEVGARDGLQNEKALVPTDIKIEFINQLSKTGLKNIEVTSFVSAQKIPQLADCIDVFKSIDKLPGIHYPVLVPNITGLEKALDAGANEIAVFTSASETFCQKNINCSIAESFKRFNEIFEMLPPSVKVRGYLSCAFGCPYEGKVPHHKVIEISKKLLNLGCYELSIGDTIGVATPLKAQNLFAQLAAELPRTQLAAHFHDTYGTALANIFASLQVGIGTFDASVAGLGGCPYAKGATGNVCTEDVVFMLHDSGIQTGIDLEALTQVGSFITEKIGARNKSKVSRARTQ